MPTGGSAQESSADDMDDVPDVMNNDATSITLTNLQFENGDNCPVSTSVRDQSGRLDSVNSLTCKLSLRLKVITWLLVVMILTDATMT